jgi:hypothetical protein
MILKAAEQGLVPGNLAVEANWPVPLKKVAAKKFAN